MRETWRTWLWEYLTVFFVPLWALGVVGAIGNWDWMIIGAATASLALWIGRICLYHKYPTRGDLPEYKEYQASLENRWAEMRKQFRKECGLHVKEGGDESEHS